MIDFRFFSTSHRLRLGVLVILLNVFLVHSAHAVSNKIVAIVNNDVITESELGSKLRLILANQSHPLHSRLNGVNDESKAKDAVLDSLISEAVQRQYAKEVKLNVSQDIVNREIGNLAAANKMTVSQFQQVIEEKGVDWVLFKRDIETTLIVQQLMRNVVAPSIKVSDLEIEEFLRQSGIRDKADSYKFHHLFAKLASNDGDKVTAEVEDVLRTQLELIKAESSSIEEFRLAAKTLAESDSNIEYTDVGERRANQLPDLFVQEFKTMEAGSLSEIISSGGALHVLFLEEKKSAIPVGAEKRKLAHILLTAETDEERKVATLRLNKLRQRAIAGESFAKLASQISDDSNSAALGGELGWVKPGDTVPTFEKAAFTLKEIGVVSLPVQTRFGVHIVKLLGVSNQDKDESMKAIARSRLVSQKASQQYPVWLNDLVNKAYVERL